MRPTVEEPPVRADLGARLGLGRSDDVDTFEVDAPADLDDIQPAARRLLATIPPPVAAALTARDRVASILGGRGGRHGVTRWAEDEPVVVDGRLSILRVYRVDAHEMVLGDDERLMDYRIMLRLDPRTRRLTFATAVRYRNLLGRIYLTAGLAGHRWLIRSMMRRFAGG